MGRIGVGVGAAILVAAGTAAAIVVPRVVSGPSSATVVAAADTYASTAHADVNYGTADALRLDSVPRITSYLRFDLGPVPVHVASALLRLTLQTPGAATVQVHAVTDGSWSESVLTSDNAPPIGPALATSRQDGSDTTTVDVTPLVEGQRTVDIALTTGAHTALRFDSRESSHPPTLVLGSPTPIQAPAHQTSQVDLAGLVEDVGAATGKRYATRDDAGSSMDSLKIVDSPAGGYLGVYHAADPSGVLTAYVSTSSDLLHWQRRAALDVHASQPTLQVLPDRGVLVAEEADSNGDPAGARTWVRLRHYRDIDALLAAHADNTFDVPHTRVGRTGAEGTPDIRNVLFRPDLARSTIEIGFHYFANGQEDRQARGVLTDFRTWTSAPATDVDTALAGLGVRGSIGDRDSVVIDGRRSTLVEARATATANAPWATYLYDETGRTARRLAIRTDGGSAGFANPSITAVRAPSGAPAFVVTLFLPVTSAASGEAGELVFYRETADRPADEDPVVAAAGDIACATDSATTSSTTTCAQGQTAQAVQALAPNAVLPLGDEQYDTGKLTQFLSSYDPSWGRFRSISYPVPGNHEYGTAGAAGYFDYFGPAAGTRGEGWYSYDLGSWHLVALNSECGNLNGGCGEGSPQERWLAADLAAHPARCTLAYWHEPLFSSGVHGDNIALAALFTDLYRAGTDVVLSGHDHEYERFAPQDPSGRLDPALGIRQFVVGTGGKSEREFDKPLPNSEVRDTAAHGVLRLALHPDGYDWQFVPVGGATFTDSGTQQCH